MSPLACARTGFPEGGPVDAAPPVVAQTIPADRDIDVPRDVQVEIVYNEPLAPGVQAQVGRLVFFNPDRPEVVTNAGGKKIEIQPRSPLEARTTYSVVVQPGLTDRRENVTKEPVRILFSTGGPLTLSLLTGKVISGGKPAVGTSVHAFNAERGFGYHALTDSSGAFELPSVALGSYQVTAWNETNGEEGFQFTLEAGDSAVADIQELGSGIELDLNLVQADTSAPRLVRAEAVARDGLQLGFSDTLARDQAFDPGRAELLAVPTAVVPRGTPLDSVPQSDVRGLPIPVEEVRYDTLEPRSLLLRLAAALADTSLFAVRVKGVRNVAGLVGLEEPPWLLFRTRDVPDSTLTARPAAGGVAGDTVPRAAPGAAPGLEAAPGQQPGQVDSVPAGPPVERDTTGVDTLPAEARSPGDTLRPGRQTPADTLPGGTEAPTDTVQFRNRSPADTL